MSISPETTNYMIAGYAVFFLVFTFYIVSLVVRWSNLRRDMHILEDLEIDNKS